MLLSEAPDVAVRRERGDERVLSGGEAEHDLDARFGLTSPVLPQIVPVVGTWESYGRLGLL
jgi:hypothetical protein